MELTGRTEEQINGLSAIEPVYHGEYGDVCRIYLAGGKTLLDLRSMRSVKHAITRQKALDQMYLRRLCGEQLERQLSLPLPLSAGLVLVPLKMRQPLTGNDSAYGLINLLAVRKVAAGSGGGALVILDCGRSLKVLASKETTLSHLAEGSLLRQHFLQKVWQI